MRNVRTMLVVALGVFFSTLPAAAQPADEQKINLARVPAVVKQAAARAVPEATFDEAYQETEKGRTVYTLDGTNRQGRDISIDVSAEGRVLEVTTEIPLTQVPKIVINAVRARVRGFRPSDASVITEEGKVTWYELEGKSAGGAEIDLLVSPDGRTVREAEDDD